MKIVQYEVASISTELDLVRTFQIKRLSELCSVLIIRKNSLFYLIKCRPHYEKYIHTEDFKIINKYDLSVNGIDDIYKKLDSKIESIMPDNKMIIFDM